MNFFSQISGLIPEGVDLNITVRRSGNRLIVSVIPKSNSLKNEAQNRLAPLVVTGTTDELNEGFIEAISNPIKQATGLLVNMSDFEKSAKEAEANSKSSKADKGKKSGDKTEKKEAPVVKKPEINQNSLFDDVQEEEPMGDSKEEMRILDEELAEVEDNENEDENETEGEDE